jgi:hypothetical protein
VNDSRISQTLGIFPKLQTIGREYIIYKDSKPVSVVKEFFAEDNLSSFLGPLLTHSTD